MRHSNSNQDEVKVAVYEADMSAEAERMQFWQEVMAIALIGLSAWGISCWLQAVTC